MSEYYNRQGEPITSAEWATSLKSQRRVAEDVVGPYWISTVWLGLNHQFGDGAQLIFETMVFPHNGKDVSGWSELDSNRYSTEAEALEGHAEFVKRYREMGEAQGVGVGEG